MSCGLMLSMGKKPGEPRKKIIGKEKPKKPGREKNEKNELLDRQNYLMQMQKGSKDQKLNTEQNSAWEFYKSLGRYDEKKKAIVAAWNVDRAMGKWKNTFQESFGKETTKEKEALERFCTKSFGSIFLHTLTFPFS
jgi:hypothetical protein